MNEPASRTRAQLALSAEVAIKLLDWSQSSRAERRLRLMQELTAAALIQSAHVVRILDHGFTTAGRGFIIMERLHGQDLEQRVERAPPLTPSELIAIVRSACAGLAAGHALGIVHRNIEPSHLFLDAADGQRVVKLLNFGLTCDPSDTEPGAARASAFVSVYASPEQRRGRVADARSDLYSLALVAYRCVAGRLPSGSLGPSEAPEAAPSGLGDGLPAALREWFGAMLREDPDARLCQSAAALAQSFAAACGFFPTPPGATSRSVGVPRSLTVPKLPRAFDPAARRRWRRAGITLGGSAFVATASAIFLFWPRLPPEAMPALEPRETSTRPTPETSAPLVIHVYVSVMPREARLSLDGQSLADNPFSSVRLADAVPHRLRAEAPGHQSIEREIVLARDLTIELMLSPVAAPAPGVRPAERSAKVEPHRAAPAQRLLSISPATDRPALRAASPEPKTMKIPLAVDRTNPWREP